MKKQIKLYNVLFPVWMLMLFPQMWLIVLPGNFLIDSLILIMSMYILKIVEKRGFYKQNILKIFLFGLLADAIGAVYMFIMAYCFEVGIMGDEWYLTVPGILISAFGIFLLNYFVTFRKTEKTTRLRLSVIFAVVTAPYTFLIPTSWLYY